MSISSFTDSKFIQEMVYQILLESPEFYRRYYKNILVSFFSGDTVECLYLVCLMIAFHVQRSR